jgi:hypothetical protein
MHHVDIELLPCPFCRSKDVSLVAIDWRKGVRCSSCHAQGPKVQTPSNVAHSNEAALKWNEYGINIVGIKENIKKNVKKKQIA